MRVPRTLKLSQVLSRYCSSMLEFKNHCSVMSQLSVDCLSAPNWSFTVCSAKKGSGPFKYLSFTACHSVRLCQPWRDTAVTRGLPSWFWGSGSAASWDPGILSMSYSWSTWGLPGSQLLWCRHWLQHQALRVHVAFPAPVSAVGSFFTARLWACWQLC